METGKNEAAPSSGSDPKPPGLRILMIGGRELFGQPSTKSAAGNIILGRRVFDASLRTAQSVVRQHNVHGRRVTLVNSPHWWWHFPRENTSRLDQMEIKYSVHLCPPGPHAVLLVIPAGIMFFQVFQISLMEHLQLLPEGVLDHTILLFTVEDENVQKRVDQLDNDLKVWPALQWLLQQCGNRKHFLNIKSQQDDAQVRTLFEKIEAMVSGNGGGHYAVDVDEGNALRKEREGIVIRALKRNAEVRKGRQKLKALIKGGKTPPSHLRLVMVGAEWSGKSSAGNTILGKNAFRVDRGRTKNCEISHSVVENRRLTVVDSAGWFYNHRLQDTCRMDRIEIENSVHQCSPGPHAVLLVVGLASAFNASALTAVQEHMTLLGDQVWKHTLVLFTRGDWLGVKTVEERVESEEGLRWLVEKCGNRYHVLDNTNRLDGAQVRDLLEKVEEMCVGNKESHYEVDPRRVMKMEVSREERQRTARRMWEMSQRQERILLELYRGERRQLADMRIVLVGREESGKSVAGNRILSAELFDLLSMKKEFQNRRRNVMCVKHQKIISGGNISVVETPGWPTDGKTPGWLINEVRLAVSMCTPGPHAFLLVVPISKAFTENDAKAVVDLLTPYGESVWRHCMVLFMWGDWLKDRSVEDYIAAEGKKLQWLLEKCGNRYHVFSFRSLFFPTSELLRKIKDMVTRNKGSFFTNKDSLPKKQKTSLFGRATQTLLTEEDWSRREQELIDRVFKALAQEPEEPTKPSERMANSFDGAYLPTMSGDAHSEAGSLLWHLRTRSRVSEWLRNKVVNSDGTSGVGSMSSSASYMESLDQSPVDDPHMIEFYFPETNKVKLDAGVCEVADADAERTQRRHSL